MASGSLHPILRHLRSATTRGEAASLGDGPLLERFLTLRDEAAFRVLLCRHGPMVLGVCRRILGNAHDAEDAFQATFLVLVRKGACVQPPERVAGWLHAVARRTALEARRLAARRRAREAHAAIPPPTSAALDPDIQAILDQELGGLPEKYRTPVVLCDLEGQTREEAARRLACPVGTISSRLARARRLLARRLVRRGLAPALTLPTGQSLAQLSPALTRGIVAAICHAPTESAGNTSSPAQLLAERVVRTMSMTRFKLTLTFLVGLVLLSTAAYRAVAAHDEKISSPPPPVVPPAVLSRDVADEKIGVKELPPVVVQTVPRSGDTEVDAAKTTEIRVTFSKEMTDESWSWAQISKETYPTSTGKPHYDKDKRTCVLPVKLQPGKTYVIWVNSEKFANFRDADGHPAVPYLLVFETKAAK